MDLSEKVKMNLNAGRFDKVDYKNGPEPNAITYKQYFKLKGGKMKIFRNIKNKVEFYLREKPELRDSDNKLVARIWYDHIQNTSPVPVSNLSALDMLKGMGDGELPAYSSIVRCRRKIQQMDSELRGKLYGERQQSQKRYIKEIKEMELYSIEKQLSNKDN